jgi:hypothetical protein
MVVAPSAAISSRRRRDRRHPDASLLTDIRMPPSFRDEGIEHRTRAAAHAP